MWIILQNELAILEFIHLLVETMDRHFGNVVSCAVIRVWGVLCLLKVISLPTLLLKCIIFFLPFPELRFNQTLIIVFFFYLLKFAV